MNLSQAMQDYLKALYKLQPRYPRGVPTSALAQRMAVAPASATNMVKRLARLGLVEHTPYQAVTLTSRGAKAALQVIRHHRLLELFLRKHLGLSIEQVHDEAETLEHALSETLEERIAALLGQPDADPHGDPIPSRSGELREQRYPRLSEAPAGPTLRVERVSDSDPRRLRWLASLALLPGAEVRILRRSAGTLTVQAGEATHRLPVRAAEGVFVREVGR